MAGVTLEVATLVVVTLVVVTLEVVTLAAMTLAVVISSCENSDPLLVCTYFWFKFYTFFFAIHPFFGLLNYTVFFSIMFSVAVLILP